MHAAKTGALFAAAGELGAIAAGAPEVATCAALGRYGMAIGIAFQHADDRDDAELTEHADAAAARMRTLCAEARGDRGRARPARRHAALRSPQWIGLARMSSAGERRTRAVDDDRGCSVREDPRVAEELG